MKETTMEDQKPQEQEQATHARATVSTGVEIESARLGLFVEMADSFVQIAEAKDPTGQNVPGFIGAERRRILDALEALFMPPPRTGYQEFAAGLGAALTEVLATPGAQKAVAEIGAAIVARLNPIVDVSDAKPERDLIAEVRNRLGLTLDDEAIRACIALLAAEQERRAAPPPGP